MITYLIAYASALITGTLYGSTFQSLLTNNPIMHGLLTGIRIISAVATCYFVLNLPAIHSILVLILCGFMVYLSTIKR